MSDLEAARAFVVQHGSEFVGCTDEGRYALIAAFATRIRAEAILETSQLCAKKILEARAAALREASTKLYNRHLELHRSLCAHEVEDVINALAAEAAR